jgi:hypothetical protein
MATDLVGQAEMRSGRNFGQASVAAAPAAVAASSSAAVAAVAGAAGVAAKPCEGPVAIARCARPRVPGASHCHHDHDQADGESESDNWDCFHLVTPCEVDFASTRSQRIVCVLPLHFPLM